MIQFRPIPYSVGSRYVVDAITSVGRGIHMQKITLDHAIKLRDELTAIIDAQPKPHVHAELMAEYAHDAAKTNKPWEYWEFKTASDRFWCSCTNSPAWRTATSYRRKPRGGL